MANIPNNEIWYTSSDGSVVTPNNSNVFGATIETNTYTNGVGIITFNGNVTTIGDSAFSGRSNLTSVTIPDSVTTIGDYAFQFCTRLTSVTIPNSVTSIGEGAFYGCSNLTHIICMPQTPPTLGDSVLPDTTKIFVPRESLETYKSNLNSYSDRIFPINFVRMRKPLIPSNQIRYTSSDGNVVEPSYTDDFGANITDNTYENGIGIITFDGNVTNIGYEAFSGCESLTSITIPDSVTSIGSEAFYGCENLTSVTIGNSLTSIGDGAFYDCESLTSITIPNTVTSIGVGAFSGCGSLTSVTIPNTVISIGGSTFQNCTGLTSVTIPNSVTSIGDGAFSGLTKILSIDIPTSVESIGENAFEEVKHINYTGNAEDTNENNWGALNRNGIFDNGFLYTDGTKTTLIGADITIIGNNVIIPNSVTTIGNRAFNGCTSLTSVTIPDSVTSIGNLSFLNCTGLTSITMGNSVTSIEYGALNGCTSLTSITSLNTTPPILGNSSTLPSHTTYTIYVPAESVDSYKAKQFWSNHASQIQAIQ